MFYIRSINDLKTFEEDLAYLVIPGMIKVDNTTKLGFDNEYIEELLIKYKALCLHPYTEYYYDKDKNVVSNTDYDARLISLSQVPSVVNKNSKNLNNG